MFGESVYVTFREADGALQGLGGIGEDQWEGRSVKARGCFFREIAENGTAAACLMKEWPITSRVRIMRVANYKSC